jgi:hypothetical protein
MSFQNPSHHTLSLVAAADLSAKQFCGVTVNSSGQAAVADTDDQIVGILQNKPGSGQAATVAYGGVSKAICGGSITAGARVTTNASGQIVAASTAGDSVVGIALQTGASGDVIAVLIKAFPFAALA